MENGAQFGQKREKEEACSSMERESESKPARHPSTLLFSPRFGPIPFPLLPSFFFLSSEIRAIFHREFRRPPSPFSSSGVVTISLRRPIEDGEGKRKKRKKVGPHSSHESFPTQDIITHFHVFLATIVRLGIITIAAMEITSDE